MMSTPNPFVPENDDQRESTTNTPETGGRNDQTKATLPTSDDMFLSPRVMDAGTFARYSEMLKSIIAQATTQGRSLEDFSADAEELIRRANESGTTLDKRLQAGVRMLRMIDERVDRTDEALDRVRDAIPSTDVMRRQTETMLNETLDKAQEQLDAMVRDAEIRAQAAEHRARVAMQKADDQTQRLEAMHADLDMRMSAIENRMLEAEERGGQTIGIIDRRLVAFQEDLTTQVDQIVERAETATAEIEGRVQQATTSTTVRIESLQSSLAPIQEAAERAMKTLGMDPANPDIADSPLSKIESLVERGETQLASVDRLFRQIEELRNQAEGVKGAFGAWLVDSAIQLDELEARKDLLSGPISDAARRISEIGPDVEDKLELASNKLEHMSAQSVELKDAINLSTQLAERANDKLLNQSAQLQALLDGSLHRLTQRVEQAGVWLGSLITRAEHMGQQLGAPPASTQAAADVLKTVEELQTKVTELGQPQSQPQEAVHVAVQEAVRAAANPTPIAQPSKTEAQAEPKPNTQPATPTEGQPVEQVTNQPTAQKSVTESKLPDRLPIDSISFEGAAVVVEHNDGMQGAD